MLVFEVIKCAAKFKTLTVKTYFYLNATIKECTKIRNPNRHSIVNRFLNVFCMNFILSQSRKRKCKKKWTTYTRHTSLEIIPNQVMPLINHDGRFRRRRIMFFNHIELKHVKKKWNCRKFFVLELLSWEIDKWKWFVFHTILGKLRNHLKNRENVYKGV